MTKRSARHLVLATFMLFTMRISAGYAQEYDCVVMGKTNPAHDLKAVADAVAKGGTILLKGVFDFGREGRVKIVDDIEIHGEVDDRKEPVTRIVGGFWTFHSPLPSNDGPLDGQGPKITIKNIHFEGAVWTPIHLSHTSGAGILNNRMTGVRPYPLPYKWEGGESLFVQAGAVIGTRFEHRKEPIPGAVTGSLVFSGNHVDLKSEHPEVTLGQGVFFNWTWGADIEVSGNTVVNASRNALESLDNYMDTDGRGSVVIAGNSVITPDTGIPFPTPNTPNGIVVGWFYDPAGGADPARNSKVTIFGNTLSLNGQASCGILCLSDGASVSNNVIEMGGDAESRGVGILASNAFVSGNRIKGAGKWALFSVPWRDRRADHNTFVQNEVKDFSASAGDLFWAGNHNLLIGEPIKTVDKGIGNRTMIVSPGMPQ